MLAGRHAVSPLHGRRLPNPCRQAVPAPRDSPLHLPGPGDHHGRRQRRHVGHQGLRPAPQDARRVHGRVTRVLHHVGHVPVRAPQGDGGRRGRLQGTRPCPTLVRWPEAYTHASSARNGDSLGPNVPRLGRKPRRATTCLCFRRSGTMLCAISRMAAACCLPMPRRATPSCGTPSAQRTRTSVCTWGRRAPMPAPWASASSSGWRVLLSVQHPRMHACVVHVLAAERCLAHNSCMWSCVIMFFVVVQPPPMPPANCPPLPLTRTCCHAARSVDDFKQGTLAEALDLLNKKEYETEEGAQNMIERIWCFEDHCPTPALGFYEGNLEWAKEVRPGVCVHTQSAHWAHTRHTHGTCVHVCTRAPHTFTCVYSAASPAATTPIWHIAPDISRVSISHLPPLPPPPPTSTLFPSLCPCATIPARSDVWQTHTPCSASFTARSPSRRSGALRPTTARCALCHCALCRCQ